MRPPLLIIDCTGRRRKGWFARFLREGGEGHEGKREATKCQWSSDAKIALGISCALIMAIAICIYPMRPIDRFNSLNTAWDATASLYLWRLNFYNYKITTLWGQTNSWCWPMCISNIIWCGYRSQNKLVGYASLPFTKFNCYLLYFHSYSQLPCLFI